MEPIQQLGLLVLAVLITLGIILFIVVGVNSQAGTYKNTSDWLMTNLTQQAEEAKSGVIIGR